MRDAVADVLAERAHLGRRRGPSFVASIVLHAIIALVVILSALSTPAPERPRNVNIRFARPASTAPAAPAKPAGVKAVPTPAPVVPPAPKETPKAEAPKREAYAPKKESIFGQSSKPVAPPDSKPATKTEPAAVPVPSQPAATGTGELALPAVGTAGVTGLEGGDFPYTLYVDQMVRKIGTNWFRPTTRGEPLAEVYFVIERDGRIRDAKITAPSGVSAFDRAALRAILDSSPLAPLPFGYRGTWLGVRLTFH